jgi:dTDP-glucose pyrophosphorylase
MLQILVPMAGRGSRFINSDFIEPKPLISWNNKNMIQHVVDNFFASDVNFFIIKREEHTISFENDEVNIIDINYVTDGPATTAYLAKDLIDLEQELIITNCDQIIKDWNKDLFLSFARRYDGVLGCFISNSNKNSYVKVDDNNLVTDVKEKVVISNIATNGLHYWKKAKYFFESYDEMKLNNDRTNNELYVAPSYNYLIKNKYKIGIYMFNQHFPIGTPEDLKKYLKNENN